jgi:hypothetical protein
MPPNNIINLYFQNFTLHTNRGVLIQTLKLKAALL